MEEKFLLDQANPFVRYIRFIELDSQANFPIYKPYDCRFFYAVKGNGDIWVDGKEYSMKKGDVLTFKSTVPYQIMAPKKDGVSYIEIDFDYIFKIDTPTHPILPDIPQNFNVENAIQQVNFVYAASFLNSPVFIENIIAVENRLMDIYREYQTNTWYYNGVNSNLFHSILLTIARNITPKEYGENINRVNNIIRYIHEHYSDKLTNKDIGNHFWLNPNYVNNLMVSQTGSSLHHYLNNFRISKAIELLQTTDMAIAEVSDAVGFKDACHFSRYFKQSTGRNPRDFKNH